MAMSARDPRATDKFVMEMLRECVKSSKKVNALGSKASYDRVTQARGEYQIAAYQLAMFAPHILKMLRRRKRAN